MDEIKKEVDLDRPFAEETPAGEPEVKEETKVEEEKPRVPYSRFENVNRARREAEAEAEKWRLRAIEMEERRFEAPRQETGVPNWWVQLYGDNEQSKSAFSIWNQAQESERSKIREEAESRALEAIERREQIAQESEQKNLETIDEGIESLSAFVGRDLTEDEQSKLLDVVDELTPKDDSGKYLGPLVSFDKAWEVMELRNKVSFAPARKSRDNAARVINTPSEGQPSPEQQERNKNFRPGAWGSWTSRLGREE